MEKFVKNPVRVVVGNSDEAVELGTTLFGGQCLIAVAVLGLLSKSPAAAIAIALGLGGGITLDIVAVGKVLHRIKVARTSSRGSPPTQQ